MAEVSKINVELVLNRFKRDKTWLAKKFKVNRGTIYKWINKGNIPAVHHDRILYIARKYEVELSAKDLV